MDFSLKHKMYKQYSSSVQQMPSEPVVEDVDEERVDGNRRLSEKYDESEGQQRQKKMCFKQKFN